MRRVVWVRIDIGADGATCTLAGVGHRLPMRRRVSVDTALALAAAGVPTVVRMAGGGVHRLPIAS